MHVIPWPQMSQWSLARQNCPAVPLDCLADAALAAVVEHTCLTLCLAELGPAPVLEGTCMIAVVAVAKMLNVAVDPPCEGTTAPGANPD